MLNFCSKKISCRSNDSKCLHKLDLMKNKSERLEQEVNEILSLIKVNKHLTSLLFNPCFQVRCDMDLYMEKACTFAVQIRKIYTVNVMHCECVALAIVNAIINGLNFCTCR